MKPVGLLLVDKPEGPTSHDVVRTVRRAMGVRRVGHTGTLDPFASGLLVLCVGWVARLAEYVSGLPKVYRGVIRLGERTDTDDRTGAVIARSEAWRQVEVEQVRQALRDQLGEIEQLPPAYSAKKVHGERAYAVAREGGSLELQRERVRIGSLSLCAFSPPDATIEVECSRGTYVRAIARDVGEAIGVGGHLRSLRRFGVGAFRAEDAFPLSEYMARDEIEPRLLPPESAVAHLVQAEVDDEGAEALRHGRPISWGGEETDGPIALISAGRLIGIAEKREDGLWPKKIFS